MKSPLALLLVALLAVGCKNSTPPTDSAPGATDSAPGATDAAPQMFTLSIDNYLSWCSITEEGATYSTSMMFPEGTVVDLHGMAVNASFVWGYWTGTDGDVSPAHDVNMDTTVTMTGDKSILACCPFPPPASQTCP